MRVFLGILLALTLPPGLAVADEVVATAPMAQSPPAPAADEPLQGYVADGPDLASDARAGPCGPQAVAADGRTDTRPHGYVEVGAGTGGYRHVAAGFCKPFANGGSISMSISQGTAQGRRYGR